MTYYLLYYKDTDGETIIIGLFSSIKKAEEHADSSPWLRERFYIATMPVDQPLE